MMGGSNRKGFIRPLAIVGAVGFLIAACTSTVIPATVTPATPTPEPQPSPTPTQVPQPTPTPTPLATPTPTPLESYENDLYGFSVALPDTWTINPEPSGQASLVARFETPTEDLTVQTFVVYYPERLSPSEIAVQELAPLAGLAGFRTISESPFTMSDGEEGYQALYGFGTGSDEQRGALVFATRGTQGILLQVVGPRLVYERNFDEIDRFLNSLVVSEPTPFGLPRDETLVLALDSGPLTMDPAIATESQSIQYIDQIFGGLTALDADLNVVPDLATWAISEDGLTYTFTLVDGAQFHDGRAVTADDVVFSWERLTDPDVGSTVARTYMEDIVGVEEKLSGAASTISGLRVVDSRTVEVTIDAPKSYFISKISHSSASIVDRANVDSGDEDNPWWYQPNATGPFVVKEFRPNAAMHLQRNADYHGGQPEIENVVFRFYAGVPLRMFEDGEIDAAFLSLSEVSALQDEESSLAEEIVRQPQLSIQYVGFNTALPPFDDPQVRRAFLLALDRKALVEETLEGIGTLVHGFLPPGLPGYDDDLGEIAFSPVEAQILLEDSSYGGAENLPEIIFSTSGGIGTHLREMARMWRENLGVEIQVQIFPADSYYYQIQENATHLFDYGWIADYPDPHNFLDVLFHSETDNNVGKFTDVAIDDLLERARTETDSVTRLNLYRQAEQLLVARAVAIPLWSGERRLIIQPFVQGFTVNPQGHIDLTDVTLTDRDE